MVYVLTNLCNVTACCSM